MLRGNNCERVGLLLGGWKTDISSNTKPWSNSYVLANTWESPGNGICWMKTYIERRKWQMKITFAISKPSMESPYLWVVFMQKSQCSYPLFTLTSPVLINFSWELFHTFARYHPTISQNTNPSTSQWKAVRLQEAGQGFHRHVVLPLVPAPGEAGVRAGLCACTCSCPVGHTAALTAPRGHAASVPAQHQPTPSFFN